MDQRINEYKRNSANTILDGSGFNSDFDSDQNQNVLATTPSKTWRLRSRSEKIIYFLTPAATPAPGKYPSSDSNSSWLPSEIFRRP